MDPAPEEAREGRAGAAVHARLVELIDQLTLYGSRVRRHEAGGVHGMRVTLRRLRSLLATFQPLFDAGVVDPLRDELKWVAGELGGARDSEVVRRRLNALVASSEERALADGIEWELGAAASAGMESAVAALDSERYSQLLRDLTSVATDPPWTPDAEGLDDDFLRFRVRRDWKRLRRRVKSAHGSAGAEELDASLHEVRKAAKRLRYSAESLVRAHGEDAARLVRGAKRVQSDLGEVQDSAICQRVLRTIATSEGTPAQEVFILGGLHAQEHLRSALAEAHYARAWTKVSRKKNRRWLR
jgi:CHAD domain-containing protein